MRSFEDCCKEVAEKHGLGKRLVTGHAAKYFTEAAELYASQHGFSSKQMHDYADKQRVNCVNEIENYGGIDELCDDGSISKLQLENINFELTHNIGNTDMPDLPPSGDLQQSYDKLKDVFEDMVIDSCESKYFCTNASLETRQIYIDELKQKAGI